MITASHGASPKPERPKIFNKRQSLREKRHGARISVMMDRPASDSNISYASRNEHAEYPEMPGDVPDWIQRRSEANRGPPRPMQDFLHQDQHRNLPPTFVEDVNLYELDAEPLLTPGANDNAIPRTVSPGEWREDYGEQVARSDDDDDLAKAIELSQQEAFSGPRRTSTGGFDEDQIAEALNRSLHVSGRQ